MPVVRTMLATLVLALSSGSAFSGDRAAEASRPEGERADAQRLLDNGLRLVATGDDGPRAIALRLPVGSAADPPGREGLAELTARSLLGGGLITPDPGALRARLADQAASAWVVVTPWDSLLVLEGVRDLRGALEVALETVSVPTFPVKAVAETRATLARDLRADAAESGVRRRRVAAAELLGTPLPTPWSVAGIDREMLADLHGRAYGPKGAVVAVSGSWEGGPAAVLLAAADVLGSWRTAVERIGPVAPLLDGRRTARLLTAADASGATVAFPIPSEGAVAAALAIGASLPDGGRLLGAGESLAGALTTEGGRVLLVDLDAARPTAAVEGLLRGLERAARRAPSAAVLGAARKALQAALDEDEVVLAGAEGDAAALRDALGQVDGVAVGRAARALVGGARAIVVETADPAEERRFRRSHPGAPVHALPTPLEAAEREAAAAGEEAWRRVREAHGAAALRGVGGFTWVGQKTLLNLNDDTVSSVIGRERFDVSFERTDLRYESRRGKSEAGRLVTVVAGDEAVTSVIIGQLPVDDIGRLALVRRRARLLPILLAHENPVVRRIADGAMEVLDDDAWRSSVEVDPATNLVVGVSYDNQFTGDVERVITLRFSDFRPVGTPQAGAAVVLPWKQTRQASGDLLGIMAIDETRAWRLHPPPFDPLALQVDRNDIEREVP